MFKATLAKVIFNMEERIRQESKLTKYNISFSRVMREVRDLYGTLHEYE